MTRTPAPDTAEGRLTEIVDEWAVFGRAAADAVPPGAMPRLLQDLGHVLNDLHTTRAGLNETIEERYRAQAAADKLAYAIAPVEAIGEHSSGNDPWANALDVLHERPDLTRKALNAAQALNGTHERTIARLREQLEQAQKAPGLAGETRVFSGYDDDYGIPLFVNLADAKAYAEMDREARYPNGEDGDEPVGWVEREARTEHVGYPDMWDMDGGNFVVHGIRVHPSLASALAERPIEKAEPESEPQIPGQSVIALAGAETSR